MLYCILKYKYVKTDILSSVFRMNMFLDMVRRNDRMSHHPIYDLDDLDHNQNGMNPFVQELSDNYPSTTLQRPISGI